MEYTYYELKACELSNCTPEEMFEKKKKMECVLALQMSMYYFKNTVELISLKKVGARYGKHHATVLHAIRTINNRMESDKKFKVMIENYMDWCLNKKQEIENVEIGTKEIDEVGFIQFIETQISIFNYLIDKLYDLKQGTKNNSDILASCQKVSESINKIEHIFLN